jgi:serine/threonine protein phosphatase PrpC
MQTAPHTAAMLSHPGLIRRHNEDACAAAPEHGAFVVCDGIGGVAGGEIASRLAADAFVASLVATAQDAAPPQQRVAQAIRCANSRILAQARQSRSLRGMGTTLVSLLLEPSPDNTPGSSWGNVWLANVGDSRCYRLRHNAFDQLTHDHSYVEEQVRAGELTREQADHSPIRNVITRAVGCSAHVKPDIDCHPAQSGDLYLLTTDGLLRELTDHEIVEIITPAATPLAATNPSLLQARCDALIAAANHNGGGDNITCLLVYLP